MKVKLTPKTNAPVTENDLDRDAHNKEREHNYNTRNRMFSYVNNKSILFCVIIQLPFLIGQENTPFQSELFYKNYWISISYFSYW